MFIALQWYIADGFQKATTGSVKFISTKLTKLVSLEQSHHKPMGMYGGVLLSWQYEMSEVHPYPEKSLG